MAINYGPWKKTVNQKNYVEFVSLKNKKYTFVGSVSGMRATRLWEWAVEVRGESIDKGMSSTLEEALYSAARMVDSYEEKRNDRR